MNIFQFVACAGIPGGCWSCWLRVRFEHFEHGETALLNFNYCNVLEKGTWGWVKLAPMFVGHSKYEASNQEHPWHIPSISFDCRLLQNICGKPDSFVGPFSKRVFSSLCEMQTTRYEGDRSEIACLQSHGAMYRVGVSPVLHEWRGRNSAREKKRCDGTELLGLECRALCVHVQLGHRIFSCKLHEPNGFSQKDVTVYKFGAVRCISAACNFACSTCFSHQAESVKIDSPRQCTWKVCRIRFHQFFRYLECSFLTWRGNQDTYHKGKHHTGSTISPLQISEFLQYHFIKHQWLLKPQQPKVGVRWWSNMPVSTAITSLAGRDDGGRHSPAVRGAGRSAQCYLGRNQAGRSETVCGNWIIWFIYQLMDYGKSNRSNNETP